MGTSSSHELERYKYRGPTVEDPDAPNVRGRFKKKPRVDQVTSNATEIVEDQAANLSGAVAGSSTAINDPDDDLSFLDEAESDVSIEDPATSANDLGVAVPASDLAAELTSDPVEAGDFDLHGNEDQQQFVGYKGNRLQLFF